MLNWLKQAEDAGMDDHIAKPIHLWNMLPPYSNGFKWTAVFMAQKTNSLRRATRERNFIVPNQSKSLTRTRPRRTQNQAPFYIRLLKRFLATQNETSSGSVVLDLDKPRSAWRWATRHRSYLKVVVQAPLGMTPLETLIRQIGEKALWNDRQKNDISPIRF